MNPNFRGLWPALLVSCLFPLAGRLEASETIQVQAGTEVRLQLAESLSSEQDFVGRTFNLAVVKDVRARGRVVIPRGTEAVGVVTRAAESQLMGQPGELHVRVDYLKLDGRRIPLHSGMGQQGKRSEVASVLLTAVFGPLGVVKRGKEVVLPVGLPMLAYVDRAFEVPVPAAPALAINTEAVALPAQPAPVPPQPATIESGKSDANETTTPRIEDASKNNATH